MRAVAGAAACGVVVASGQAPLGWWWAALPALAAFVHLVAGAARGRGWIAWFGGAGYFAAALAWIVEPFLIAPEIHGWMAPFAVVFLSFGLALFWALAAVAARGRFAALGFALGLTVAEFARAHVLTGFPWAMIGHVWIGHAPAQLAAMVGPFGLTLFTLVAAALLAARRLGLAVLAVAMVGAAFGFGAWRLAGPEPAPRAALLRLVQPNAEQGLKWDPDQARLFFERQLSFTAAGARPDLAIWPETAVPYLIDEYPEVARRIAEAGRGNPVAVGVQRVAGWQYWNSLAVIGQGGRIEASYDKHHLVPFGEYIPFGDLLYDWFGLVAFAAQQGNGYSPGPGPAVLDLGGDLGKVLPLICYEVIFPQDVRAAPERADWMLQITNDAWFGTWSGPFQHMAQARLRAIEQGLPLVRVANTGVTAVVDARGRVLDQLPFGEPGYLDAPLPGALPPTVYARWGDGPVILLIGLLMAGLWVAGRRTSA
ncbi:apolipoprotein N-acyltransferase [Rhodobacter sp. CCP-1]|uniref:Apolipoprotein N-acyltransferase n=1 Tax=Paragemmobacter ruber TaxID=1985673 RepID=A0ABW9Y6H4_9RHOB|nr:apolipoprotein N-acyltransferase [Rhodobacter ruber]